MTICFASSYILNGYNLSPGSHSRGNIADGIHPRFSRGIPEANRRSFVVPFLEAKKRESSRKCFWSIYKRLLRDPAALSKGYLRGDQQKRPRAAILFAILFSLRTIKSINKKILI